MKSKLSVILQKASVLLSAIGYLISVVALPSNSVLRIGLLILLSVSCGWHVINTKCPHCGRVGGLKPKPFTKDAGKCIHCGELVEYK